MMVFRNDPKKVKKALEIQKKIDKIGNKYKKIIGKEIENYLRKKNITGKADIIIDIQLSANLGT